MADAIRKTLKKIQRKFTPPLKIEPLWKKQLVMEQAEKYRMEFWERDKKIVRDANFKKALIARAEQLERINVEKARQEEIAQRRLDNLKKARRKLKRMRNNP